MLVMITGNKIDPSLTNFIFEGIELKIWLGSFVVTEVQRKSNEQKHFRAVLNTFKFETKLPSRGLFWHLIPLTSLQKTRSS